MTEQRNFTADSFYKFVSEKKLMASRCKKCQAMFLPPHPICIKCFGIEMEWVELKGTGKLAAFSAISVGPTCTLAEGHDRNNPYVVGIVKMDEGPKICGRIHGIDPKSPEKIKVGTHLKLEFPEQKAGGRAYLNFRVVG